MSSTLDDILFRKEYDPVKGPLFTSKIQLAEAIVASSSNYKNANSVQALLSRNIKKGSNMSPPLAKAIKLAVQTKAALNMSGKEVLLAELMRDFDHAVGIVPLFDKNYIKTSLRIAVGYLNIALPIISLMYEESRAQKEFGRKSKFEISFYGEESYSGILPQFNTLSPPNNSKRAYTANDLSELMQDQKVDAVCAIQSVFDRTSLGTDLAYTNVASIVESDHTGLYLIVFWKKSVSGTHFEQSMPIDKVIDIAYEINQGKVFVNYYGNTISEFALDQLYNFKPEIFEKKIIHYGIPEHIQNQPGNKIIDILSALDAGSIIHENTHIFIGWKPHVDWYIKEMNDHFSHLVIPLNLKTKISGDQQYSDIQKKSQKLRFSLLVRNEVLTSEKGLTLCTDFVDSLARFCSKLESPKARSSGDFLNSVYPFLGYKKTDSIDLIWKEIDEMNYNITYNRDFVRNTIAKIISQ